MFEFELGKKLENFGLFYSVYRAKVVDNKDEENRGRIKVIVPGIIEIPKEGIIAEPCFSFCGRDYGEFIVPEVGDIVWVLFEQGDPKCPVWLGSWFTKEEVPEEFKKESKVRGWKTPYGHVFIFDDKDKLIECHTKEGLKLVLDDNNDRIVLDDKGRRIVIDNRAGRMVLDNKGRKIILTDNEIKIGSESSSQPLVLGYSLLAWLSTLYAWASAVGGMVGLLPVNFGCQAPTPQTFLSQQQKTE